MVESQATGDDAADMAAQALTLRLRQQEILAELGVLALKGTPFAELIERTVALTAEGLQAEFCKTMEYLPKENRLLVTAGVGWDAGVIGHAMVGADLDSPAGFALQTGKPVISNHLENEERFRTPELLLEHGIRRAINVILQGDGRPYGVLEVDSRSAGEFTGHDIAFLQGAANLLGMAIERQRFERDLKAALEHQEVLLQEGNHRVTNSLQLVAGMLSLQATSTTTGKLREQLQEAISRISAISRAHRRLYRTKQIKTLVLGDYLIDVCHDLVDVVPRCDVKIAVADDFQVATDRAISISLIVTELVTNAAKHAYPKAQACQVWVTLSRQEPDRIIISVRDDGRGLPAGFDVGRRKGLGMRIISAMMAQLQADLIVNRLERGTEFVLDIPLNTAEPA